MLNKEKHQLIMGQILKDIYADISMSSLLGLKGGTCAYFFYGLPRFSVDLDFDMLEQSEEKQKIISDKIAVILKKYGQVKDHYVKKHTLFSLLSYGNEDHNIKIEINIRKLVADVRSHYEAREYLGILVLVAQKDYLFGGKLVALTSRLKPVMRDVFDADYFAKNRWDINEEIIKNATNKSLKDYLPDCIAFIEKINNKKILQGLGELVNGEKEKDWIRNNLKSDTVFMLKNYLSVVKNS